MGFRIESVRFKNKFMYGLVPNISTGHNLVANDNYYTLIIGNNGCGKTSLMNAIANFYCETKSRYSPTTDVITTGSNPQRIIATTNGIGDTFPNDESDKINYRDLRYVYLGTRFYGNYSKKYLLERAALLFLESDKTFDQISVNKDICQFVGYDTNIKLRYALKDAFKAKGTVLKKAIASLRNKKTGPTSEEIARLENILPEIKDAIELWVNFSADLYDLHGVRNLELFLFLRKLKALQLKNVMISKDNSNPPISFDNVSSGEANLLSSLLSLNSSIKSDSLVLIDEPEISLHPEWQIKYMSKIQSIMSQVKGCHVIIASHSHFMVSDLNPENSSLVILEKKKDEVGSYILSSRNPNANPYAWSAENILLEVFNVSSTRNFYFAQKVEEALDLLGKHNRNNERLDFLKDEIRKVLVNLSPNDPLLSVATIILNANV